MKTLLPAAANTRMTATHIIASLLIFLFVYTAVSKLIVFSEFEQQMLNQAIPEWSASMLTWTLPSVELMTAAFLLFQRYRIIGMWMSCALMIMFTFYIIFVLTGLSDRYPCSCGGVLKSMSWTSHLIFNIFFLLLTIIGIKTINRERRVIGKE